MSISTFQEKLFRGGCGLAVLLLCAAVMIGGVFYTSCMYGNTGTNGPKSTPRVVMQIAGIPVEADRMQQAASEALSRMSSQSPGPAGPDQVTSANSSVLDQFITSGAEIAALKKLNIQPDEKLLETLGTSRFEQQLMMARMQMSMNHELSPGATDADFDAAIKKQTGKTSAELKADNQKTLKENLADKDKRESMVKMMARDILLDADAKSHKVSDAELIASYNNETFKRILIRNNTPGADKPEDRLQKAQADLAKGMTFEKAIDAYSTDLPMGKKKLSESTTDYMPSQMTSDPNLKPLLGLKVGDVSPIITTPEGKAIYKLISIKSNLPPDFAKSKEKYRTEFAKSEAEKVVTSQIESAKAAPDFIVFKSAAYKALHDYSLANAHSPTGPPAPTMQSVYDEAKAVGESPDSKVALAVQYSALKALAGDVKVDQKKLAAEKLETDIAVLRTYESYDIRMELARLYTDDKKGSEAGEQLLLASQNNSLYNQVGFQRFGEIRDQLQILRRAKLIEEPDAKKIDDAQLDWSKQRAEDEKQQLEAKKQAAADEAANRAAKAAEAAAEAKLHPNAAPSKAPPSIGSVSVPGMPGVKVQATPALPGKAPAGPATTVGAPKK